MHHAWQVVVVFRGTTNAHDVLTDLHCSTGTLRCNLHTPHSHNNEEEVEAATAAAVVDEATVSARVHEGFLQTAVACDQTLLPKCVPLIHHHLIHSPSIN